MTTDALNTNSLSSSVAGRVSGMVYALLAYMIGAGSLFWLFFAAGGFVPYGLSSLQFESVPGALAFNALLVFGFAVQHTVMARKSFKQWITRIFPAHLERANYILMSGIMTLLIVWFWQPLPGNVWTVASPALRTTILAVYVLGILYVLASSLITNHFELFGLRQAWLNLVGKAYTPLAFKKVWFYRYSRHPMMLGMLLVLWATPDMSLTRLSLALLLTVYLFAGIRFEEHSLLQEFGDKYREYRREIGLFFTFGK